uniref:Arrestin domain containing 3a n=1 Tax=Callorhinchus milii TaxID=7868 RepID=A0A4W3JB96_CALMI
LSLSHILSLASESLSALSPSLSRFYSTPFSHALSLPLCLYGKVEYTVEAKLNRPWKLSFSVEQPLPVFERIDINHPLLLVMLSGWCCTSGVISLNVKIRRKGYTQGEEIQIFAEFENGSSREVVPKAVIHQTQTFFAQGKSRKIQETIAKIDGEPVAPGQTGKWIGKGMLIPTLPPSYLSCRIITMEYTLMVSCFLALLVCMLIMWKERTESICIINNAN